MRLPGGDGPLLRLGLVAGHDLFLLHAAAGWGMARRARWVTWLEAWRLGWPRTSARWPRLGRGQHMAAELHVHDPPATVARDRDEGADQCAAAVLAAIPGGLGLDADRDGRLVDHPHVVGGPHERIDRQVPSAVAVEPAILVEHEPSPRRRVSRGPERVQRDGVAAGFGVAPRRAAVLECFFMLGVPGTKPWVTSSNRPVSRPGRLLGQSAGTGSPRLDNRASSFPAGT